MSMISTYTGGRPLIVDVSRYHALATAVGGYPVLC